MINAHLLKAVMKGGLDLADVGGWRRFVGEQTGDFV